MYRRHYAAENVTSSKTTRTSTTATATTTTTYYKHVQGFYRVLGYNGIHTAHTDNDTTHSSVTEIMACCMKQCLNKVDSLETVYDF